jgi:CheY-like chemotaxis protein
MNILVVDDEPQFKLLLKTFLAVDGNRVFLAENGEDALALMEQTGIDLVISDVYMPVMDGIKFHRTLREIPGYEQVPVLFISGFDDQYTLEAVKNPKIDGFFKKGRPMAELREWVAYLTAPEEKRPKLPPGGRDISKAERLDRTDRREGPKTPRL